jgi:hypothetical protein
VRGALTRINPQLAGRKIDERYPVADELYQYVVAEGRLYKTFPDLLRDVLVHALPEPGVWLQGTIIEADGATTIVTHPEEPGGRREEVRTLTTAAERAAAASMSPRRSSRAKAASSRAPAPWSARASAFTRASSADARGRRPR